MSQQQLLFVGTTQQTPGLYSVSGTTYAISEGGSIYGPYQRVSIDLTTSNVSVGTTIYYTIVPYQFSPNHPISAFTESDIDYTKSNTLGAGLTVGTFNGSITAGSTSGNYTSGLTTFGLMFVANDGFEGDEFFTIKFYTDSGRTNLVATFLYATVYDSPSTTATVSLTSPTSNVHITQTNISARANTWATKPYEWSTGHGTNTTGNTIDLSYTNLGMGRYGDRYLYATAERVGFRYGVTVQNSVVDNYYLTSAYYNIKTLNGTVTYRGFTLPFKYNTLDYGAVKPWAPPTNVASYFKGFTAYNVSVSLGSISTDLIPASRYDTRTGAPGSLPPLSDVGAGGRIVAMYDYRLDNRASYPGDYDPDNPSQAATYNSVVSIYHPQFDPGSSYVGDIYVNGSKRFIDTIASYTYSEGYATWTYTWNIFSTSTSAIYKGLFYDISNDADVIITWYPNFHPTTSDSYYLNNPEQFPIYYDNPTLTGTPASGTFKINVAQLQSWLALSNNTTFGPAIYNIKFWKDNAGTQLLGQTKDAGVFIVVDNTSPGEKQITTVSYPASVYEHASQTTAPSGSYIDTLGPFINGWINITTKNCGPDDVIYWKVVRADSTYNNVIDLTIDNYPSPFPYTDIADFPYVLNSYNPGAGLNGGSTGYVTGADTIQPYSGFSTFQYAETTNQGYRSDNVLWPLPMRCNNSGAAKMVFPSMLGTIQPASSNTERTEKLKIAFYIKNRIRKVGNNLYPRGVGLGYIDSWSGDIPPYSGYNMSTPSFLTEEISLIDSSAYQPAASACVLTSFTISQSTAWTFDGIIEQNVWWDSYGTPLPALGTFPTGPDAGTRLTNGPGSLGGRTWVTADTLEIPKFIGCWVNGGADWYGNVAMIPYVNIAFGGDIRGAWWNQILFGGRTMNRWGNITNYVNVDTDTYPGSGSYNVGDGFWWPTNAPGSSGPGMTFTPGYLYVYKGGQYGPTSSSSWEVHNPYGVYYPANSLYTNSKAMTVWSIPITIAATGYQTYFTTTSTNFQVNYETQSSYKPYGV